MATVDPHINPATGVWDDNYYANLNKGSSSSGGGSNPQSAIQDAIKQMQEANKPAVESLRASIPETQTKFAQTKQQLQASQPNLEQQYQSLIDSIKTEKTGAVNTQTKITSGELGKRGLVGSSTLAQQEIQNAVQPVSERYTNLETSTGIQKAQAIKALQDQIANLGPQEVEATRAIQNAIAQLQSGAASSGANLGLGIYNAQQSADQFAQNQSLEQQKIQAAIDSAKSAGYQTIGEGSSIYDPATGKIIATAPKTYKDLASSAGGWE
jgi:hypothetical protein